MGHCCEGSTLLGSAFAHHRASVNRSLQILHRWSITSWRSCAWLKSELWHGSCCLSRAGPEVSSTPDCSGSPRSPPACRRCTSRTPPRRTPGHPLGPWPHPPPPSCCGGTGSALPPARTSSVRFGIGTPCRRRSHARGRAASLSVPVEGCAEVGGRARDGIPPAASPCTTAATAAAREIRDRWGRARSRIVAEHAGQGNAHEQRVYGVGLVAHSAGLLPGQPTVATEGHGADATDCPTLGGQCRHGRSCTNPGLSPPKGQCLVQVLV